MVLDGSGTLPDPGAAAVAPTIKGDHMSDATRRSFLAVAGTGVAAGAALAAAPGVAGAAVAKAPNEDKIALPADAQGSMLAYIHDVAKGEVALMIEGHELIVTDQQLVARLAQAFARAQSAQSA